MKHQTKDTIYQNRFIILSILFAVVALSVSYLAEYAWKIEPCRLCKYQRIPFFTILGFTGLTFLTHFRKATLGLIRISLLAGLVLALFHVCVLTGIISDPCQVPSNINSLEDFERLLDASIPCSKSSWKILEIPASGYNAVFCAVLFLFSLHKNEQRRRVINYPSTLK